MKTLLTAILSTLFAGAAMAADFSVSSPDMKNGRFSTTQFAHGNGCNGGNVSPALEWTNAPAGTKSFTVTMFDKDAPTGSGLWHWVLIDIPSTAMGLTQGAGTESDLLPVGARPMRNDLGMAMYDGPCPPLGQEHDYIVTVKALSVETLELDSNTSAAIVGYASNVNALAVATMTIKGKQ